MRRSVQMRMVALLGWALVSGVAWAVPVSYTNDFGTNAQLNELMWFKTDAPNTSQSPSVYPSANDPYTGSSFVAMDLNLDTMARILYVTTLANVDATGVRPFSADPFKVYDNITVSGSAGSGYPNYTTSTTGVILSATRTGYDQTSYAADYTMQAVSINGNSSINGTPRFWAGAKVTRNNAYGFDWGVPTGNGYYYSRFAELEVSADERDPAAGEQVLLTNNDFGTTAQQNAWTVTGTASPLFFASNAGDLNGDLNNDYLAGGIRFAGSTNQERTGTLSVVLRVDAPEGTAFKSIVGMANAWAYSSWGSSARLELSKDGVNYDVVGNTATNGACSLEVKSFGVEGYQALKSVWLKIYMNDNYGFDISGDHLYVDNVILTGELVSLLMTTNDLGTTAQRNEWSISGSATPAFFANNGDDLDGDNLASGIRFAGSTNQERTGILSAVLKVDAPFGNVFKNIKATADAWAYSSWGSYARLELSKDGINFDIVGDTLGTGPGSLVVDSTGITGYETVSSIWLKIYMQDNYGFDINGSYLYVDNIMLTGEWICPAPREPLTYRDSGLYCGWNDYFLRVDTPFNFFTVQAVAWEGDSQSNINWNTWLQNARQNGKRIIADLIPQAKDANNNWYGISGATDNASLDKLVAVVDEFFEEVDVNDVYAVTLGEEQIFWDGQAARLNSLYDKIKAKYDVPIYQWYSPSYRGSIPGQTWPNIKADGWMADEYFMYQQFPTMPPKPPGLEEISAEDLPGYEYAMERGMRGFRILQKPVIQIIFAGGSNGGVYPFSPTRFSGQHDVCRKYNIPTGYFTYENTGGYWGFESDAPANLESKQIFNNYVVPAAVQARTCDIPDVQTWDTMPWSPEVLKLKPFLSTSPIAVFSERFSVSRRLETSDDIDFVNSAGFVGFADLRWDSSPVQFRPGKVGASQSSMEYSFESAFNIRELTVNATGMATSGSAVSASVVDSTGTVAGTTNLTQGTLTLTVPGNCFTGRQFKVVFTMSGTAQAAGDVLAELGSFDITVKNANAVFLTDNDLGTTVQQSRWQIVEQTQTASPLFFPSNTGDLNHDGLACGIRFAGNTESQRKGTLGIVLRVDAPAGAKFKNIVGTADGWAYTHWGSSARLELSRDGVNFDVVSPTLDVGSEVGHVNSLLVDASGTSGWTDGVSTVWFKVFLCDIYGFGYEGSYNYGSQLYVNNIALTGKLVDLPGDANNDGMVDVGDLGILAANYGGSGKTWTQGDFNGDGLVDVGDLGILAANYGIGTSAALDFNAEARALGLLVDSETGNDETLIPSTLGCGLMGLILLTAMGLGLELLGGLRFRRQ